MLLKEVKMLIMITRYCSPDTSLPLPLYPFSLCPHGTSCQLGSFPPPFAAPFMQHHSHLGQGSCPSPQMRRAATGRNEGEGVKKTLSASPTHGWRLQCHPGQNDLVKMYCEDGKEPRSISCGSHFGQCCFEQLWYGSNRALTSVTE